MELSRFTPKERLDAALMRGGYRRGLPVRSLVVLASSTKRVEYILVGSLARVLQGADEIPEDVDLVIPKGARYATDEAILTFAMRPAASIGTETRGCISWEASTREVPEGTRGHRDLRRRAERVHLGGGLRPWVAAPGDLVRMMEALGRPEQAEQLEAMRRVVELEGGWHVER